jgi:hypothetical protein
MIMVEKSIMVGSVKIIFNTGGTPSRLWSAAKIVVDPA